MHGQKRELGLNMDIDSFIGKIQVVAGTKNRF